MTRRHGTLRMVGMLMALLACCAVAGAAAWRMEAEDAGDGTIAKKVPGITKDMVFWKVTEAEDASGGAYMGGARLSAETRPVACRIPRAGAYRIWVRHYKTIGKPTSFFILFRNDVDEAVGLRNIDFFNLARNLTALPEKLPETPEGAEATWAWESCEITFERPMEATFSFGPGGGLVTGKLGVDCVVVSDDPAFDPTAGDWAALPTEPGPLETVPLPWGMAPALPLERHASFFAGAPDRDDQLKLCIVHAYNLYRDYAWLIQLGFNRDRSHAAGSMKYGVQTQVNPKFGYTALDLKRSVASPEGRTVNMSGKVGRGFSYSYAPFRKVVIEELKEKLKAFDGMEEAERYGVTGESGGSFDYSNASRDAFHAWLEMRFGTIEKLNSLWRAEHKSFADVPLPKTPEPEDNKAAWFAFREFCGLEMVSLIGEEIKAINKFAPNKLPCTSQGSCLHINSPWFTSTGTIDFEDLINVGFADSKLFGYDAYSTEDGFIGCDAEFLLSLTGDREMLNGEGNTHGQDAGIAGRSYWSMVGKGLKGIDTWCLRDHPRNWVYSMWGMLKADQTPRDKLGAVADANHEIHRIERLLKPAKRRRFVKPVALYYSRMDLSLPQPLFDIYGSSIDSPYRIYAVLRGLGYPVRWITPRQILAGGLRDVGAVALIGVRYMPGEAATTLAQWVKDGGCILGDEWPGAFDEYDRQQGALAQVFGIRPKEAASATMSAEEARVALSEQQTPVYAVDPAVLKALTADEFYKSVDEMFNQRDSHHPVAQAVGNWHLSGYGGKSVEVMSGEIIGQMMGQPGLVINQHGKGHALYSSIMLGTLYEAGPVRFEWDSSREGPGLGNILDAYLLFSGLEPFAEPDLPLRMARKMRVESPLVDEHGNVLVGMISINDGPLRPFLLSLRWPDSVPVPRQVLVCRSGSRRMEEAPFLAEDGLLKVIMPGFDTHAMLLALTDSEPLVSLEVTGPPRGKARLLEVTPGARLKIKATVWNPSPNRLARGVVRLHAAEGWLCDDAEERVGAIKPFGCREETFEVMAPPLCGARTLRPIVVKYGSDNITSTPATELVWWTPGADRSVP